MKEKARPIAMFAPRPRLGPASTRGCGGRPSTRRRALYDEPGGRVPVLSPKPAGTSKWGQGGDDLERVEVSLLLEAIYRVYGFDFRSYAYASIKRRLWRRAQAEGRHPDRASRAVLHDSTCMDRLMVDLSIQVTSMFRDPPFFRALRTHVMPSLRTYPFIRVCTPAVRRREVFSLAILLKEEASMRAPGSTPPTSTRGRCARARGHLSLSKMQEYTLNYQRAAGCARSPSTTRRATTGCASSAR